MQGRGGGCCGDGEEDEAAGQFVLEVERGGGVGKRSVQRVPTSNESADRRERFYLLLK